MVGWWKHRHPAVVFDFGLVLTGKLQKLEGSLERSPCGSIGGGDAMHTFL